MKEIVVTVKYGLTVPDDFEMTDEHMDAVRKVCSMQMQVAGELSQEWEDKVWSQGWF